MGLTHGSQYSIDELDLVRWLRLYGEILSPISELAHKVSLLSDFSSQFTVLNNRLCILDTTLNISNDLHGMATQQSPSGIRSTEAELSLLSDQRSNLQVTTAG